jgi:hypothetical protein
MNTHKRIFLTFLLALCTAARVSSHPVASADGEKWLKWSDETRNAYIESYTDGFLDGFVRGCDVGQQTYSHTRPKGLPGEKCVARAPVFSKHVAYYKDKISEFYRSYPKDLAVPISEVLQGLGDERNLSLQQIDEYSGHTPRKQ